MARMFQYVRPVDAVLTSVTLGTRPDHSENGIRIKEEPPDLDYDDLNYLLTDANTTAQNVSTKSKQNHLDVVNNENNERILRPRSVCSNKDSSYFTRKKRKHTLNDSSELKDSQPAKKPRLYLRDILPLQVEDNLMIPTRTCKICFVSFKSVQSLSVHSKIYNTILICEICNTPFNSRPQLQRHISCHFHTTFMSSRKSIRCWFCNRSFCEKKRLQMHLFHCHRTLLEDEYSLQTDIDKILENMEQLCRVKRHSHISNSSTGVTTDTDKIEKNTCREDTNIRVTRNSDKVRRNMETSMTSVINDVERNIPMKEVFTMPVTNEIYQTKNNKRVDDAMVRIPRDAIKIEKDTWAVDAMISVTDDVEILDETRVTALEDILNIIGVVDDTEKSVPIEDRANRIINDADKIEENRRMEDSMEAVRGTNDITNMAAVQPCSNNDAASVAGGTNYAADIIGETSDITSMVNVTNDVDKIEESANPITDSVTQNVDQVEQNTPVEGSANHVISDNIKIESNTSIKEITDSVIDHISQNTTEASESRVTTNINKTQRNVPTVKSVGHEKKVVQKTRQTQKPIASTNSPTKLNTSSPGKKKMRQTTLTEFLSFSNKSFKEDDIKLEKVDIPQESFDASARNASRNLTFGRTSTPIPNSTAVNFSTPNTPLLKMHISPNSLLGLLNDEIKSEPVESFNSAIAQNSPYNFRKSTHDSRRSSVDSRDATPSSVASRRSRSTNTSKQIKRTTTPLEERWKNKYKCKECVVRLERCDYVSKRVLLKTDRSESIIPLQLTIGSAEGTARNGDVIKPSNPRIRIVNFDNCIVVELLESK
ncbi:uncharacterized protein LOC117605090 [Osmia lignaria lignaria]|uniref:uncharacterized protein LOC117605090 n=1 Tax=Osmia lignaria lignaria TaxID=1437193 RepID=UPI00402B4AB7